MTPLPTTPPSTTPPSTTQQRLNDWGPPSTPVNVPSGPYFDPPRPAHPTLPIAAGIGALIVLTASLLFSKVVLDLLVDREWPIAVYIALLAVVGYGPSLVWWRFATKRWGSGASLRDVGITPRWSDLGWGPVVWIVTICVQVAIGAIVLALDVPIANNTDDVGELSADRTYSVAIVITAVIAAPIVEELVFRGLVLRSLLSKLPAVIAVALQGVLFGVAHIDPALGSGNVGLTIVLSGVGIAFGSAAYLLRRIGPTMVAHAIFNGVVMILLLTGVRDRILDENPDFFENGASAEQVPVVDQAHVAEPHRGRDPHV